MLEAEVLRHLDDPRGHLVGRRIGAERLDEELVDLEVVDLELRQVGEARIAGAEIVDRHLDPGGAQLPHRLARKVDIDQAALGRLDDQGFRTRCRTRSISRFTSSRISVRCMSCAERLTAKWKSGRDPADVPRVLRQQFQHARGDQRDQPLLFGHRDEHIGRNELVLAVRRRISASTPTIRPVPRSITGW